MNHFAVLVLDVFLRGSYRHSQEPIDINEHQPDHQWLKESQYMDAGIRKALPTFQKVAHTRNFERHGVTVNFTFWDKTNNPRQAAFMLRLTEFMIEFLSRLKPIRRNLTLELINYDGKKFLPKDGIFKSKHVNSGVTFFSPFDCDVYVYRKEEMAKVLIHEMIHFFDVDAKHVDHEVESELHRHFCMSDRVDVVNVNESFTDTMACMVHTCLCAATSSPYDSISSYLKDVHLLIRQEHDFMRRQAHQVLKHVDYDPRCSSKNGEETHAIAYYVIKSLMFDHLDEFYRLMRPTNYVLTNVRVFTGFVTHIIGKVIDWSAYGKKEYKALTSKGKTMRMTTLNLKSI